MRLTQSYLGTPSFPSLNTDPIKNFKKVLCTEKFMVLPSIYVIKNENTKPRNVILNGTHLTCILHLGYCL